MHIRRAFNTDVVDRVKRQDDYLPANDYDIILKAAGLCRHHAETPAAEGPPLGDGASAIECEAH
jgi:hypothetical protein